MIVHIGLQFSGNSPRVKLMSNITSSHWLVEFTFFEAVVGMLYVPQIFFWIKWYRSFTKHSSLSWDASNVYFLIQKAIQLDFVIGSGVTHLMLIYTAALKKIKAWSSKSRLNSIYSLLFAKSSKIKLLQISTLMRLILRYRRSLNNIFSA